MTSNRVSLGLVFVCAVMVVALNASDFSTHHETRVSNAVACGDCHQAPQLGGSSSITVTRAGHLKGGRYVPGLNSGLVHTRSASQSASTILVAENIRGLRVSLNLLGDGYVEAISDETLQVIGGRQRRATKGVIHGQIVEAPVVEAGVRKKAQRVGRFGWKSQHATVVSAAADALRNELGVPNSLYLEPLVPENGEPAKGIDGKDSDKQSLLTIADADAELRDLVRFIRTSEPIAQDADLAKTPAVQSGAVLFEKIGCGICHVSSLKTAPVGTRIVRTPGVGNSNPRISISISAASERSVPLSDWTEYTVPAELGDKTIHPYSDYLLHDVGTGDGIVQTAKPGGIDLSPQAQSTANKFRTEPLWGVRFRKWMMHDGKAKTYDQAIMRHGGEARAIVKKYEDLTPGQRHQIEAFLDSL